MRRNLALTFFSFGFLLIGGWPARAATIGVRWNGVNSVWWAVYAVGGKDRISYSRVAPWKTEVRDIAP